MLICSREEANKLIDTESNLFRTDERNKDIISEYIDYETKEIKHGRGNSLNLDDEKRKEIATLALTSGLSVVEVAKLTGVSKDSVNAYMHGATSEATYNDKDNEVGKHVDELKEGIKTIAKNKLLLAMEALSPEKVHAAKAKDIAGIARDMSAVVKNMTPDSPINNNTRVLVYQPRIKEEDDFITVEATHD